MATKLPPISPEKERCYCECHALNNFGWDQKTRTCKHCSPSVSPERKKGLLYFCYFCRNDFCLDKDVPVSSLKMVEFPDGGEMPVCPKCDFERMTSPHPPSVQTWEEDPKYFDFKTIKDRDRWIMWMKTDLIPHIEAQAVKQEREKIYNQLMAKQELVTYKKDSGHGVAVPCSEIMNLLTPPAPKKEKA